ncbi:MAG: hypothetical protein ABSG68_11560 [Thermoguttaceae bacterium]
MTPDSANAQKPIVELPTITASASSDAFERARTLGEDDLCGYQRDLRQQFARKDAPDEILALATTSASDLILLPWAEPEELFEVFIYAQRGELRWFTNGSTQRYFWRQVGAEEVRSIRSFVASSKLDSLPSLDQTRIVDGKTIVLVHGTAHVLLRITARGGVRTTIFNPPSHDECSSRPPGDSLCRYTKVIDFFRTLADSKDLMIRYCLPEPVPGLQIVYAHPRNEIRAVWKDAGRLCVTVGRFDDIREEHRVFAEGKFGERLPQPRLVEERVDAVGKLPADPACASPDGRWVAGIVVEDGRLACFDRHREAFVTLDKETATNYVPLHYLEAHRAFLLARFSIHPLSEYMPLRPVAFRLLHPETGKSSDLPAGNLNIRDNVEDLPWFQRLPRYLQGADVPSSAVWLSAPSGQNTLVGRYDMEKFRWLSWQTVPRLRFQTKDIWADAPGHRVYVVYRGHLLAFPLRQRDMP